MPLGNRLGNKCIQLWDESRNISNAIEMLDNKILLTRYFEGKPDMWELKPPFVVWFQAISLKIFGFNEVAARMPSLMFSMLTILLLFWFVNKINGNIYAAIISSFILVSSYGFTAEHGVRYADHEAAIVFFSTGFVLMSFLYFAFLAKKYFAAAFVFLFLGWFTKSIVIFIFVPAILFFIIFNKKSKETFFNLSFVICSIILILLIFTYYYIRENTSPGYISEVWNNELFKRYTDSSAQYTFNLKNDYFYYLKALLIERFFPYFIIFGVAVIPVLFIKNFKNRNLILYLSFNSVFFLSVISLGTKNFWYDLPIYPIMSITAGILIVEYYSAISYKIIKPIFAIVFTGIIGLNLYKSYSNTFKPEQKDNENWRALCYFIKENKSLLPANLKIIQNGYFAPLSIYVADAKTQRKKFDLSKTLALMPGDTFLVYDDSLKKRAYKDFKPRAIMNKYGCTMYKAEK